MVSIWTRLCSVTLNNVTIVKNFKTTAVCSLGTGTATTAEAAAAAATAAQAAAAVARLSAPPDRIAARGLQR